MQRATDLCKYPELLVFTAVSTRPSRPAMQWKKYSWLRKPVRNLEIARKLFIDTGSLVRFLL